MSSVKKAKGKKTVDVSKRHKMIMDIKKKSPELSEASIGAIVGCNQSTVHRALKKYEEEFAILDEDVAVWTDNREIILEGTLKKLIVSLNKNMDELKPREIAYTAEKIHNILAKEKGLLSGSGDINAFMGLIDEMANGRLRKLENSGKIIKVENIVESEVAQ